MSSLDETLLDRLFIILPELRFDAEFLRHNEALILKLGLMPKSWIDFIEANEFEGNRVLKDLGRKKEFVRKLRGKTLIQRILLVAPEIFSSSTVDLLRSFGLIDTKTAHSFRIALAAKNALSPIFRDRKITEARAWAAFDAVFSPEMVNLLKNLEDERIQVVKNLYLKARGWERLPPFHKYPFEWVKWTENAIDGAQKARSLISTFRLGRQSLAEFRAAKNTWDAVTVTLQFVLSPTLLMNAKRAGLISKDQAAVLIHLNRYGLGAWRSIGNAFTYKSWAARALIIGEGILDHDLVEALYAAKLISPELRAFVSPAVTGIKRILRTNSDSFRKSQRMRLRPGENPLRTYLLKTEATDRTLLRLLAESAAESGKIATKLGSGTIGQKVTAKQQRLVQRELHKEMRILSENLGYMIVFGERQAEEAAIEAMEFLEKGMWGRSKELQDLRRMVQLQARSGVESFVSRAENLRPLSERVYKSLSLANGNVNEAISKALLRDLSAKEFAATVEKFIRPDVPGGVSYASMRLARTEINNAFHFTQVRYTREAPWTQAYQWHLSGSHGKPDICNDYADQDHVGMGKGVFDKSDVPGKPHPHCLCYITSKTMSNGDFERALRRGSFDKYFESLANSDFGDKGWVVPDNQAMHKMKVSAAESARAFEAGLASAAVGKIWKALAPGENFHPFSLGFDD